jgi:hypothetical protein
MIRPAALGFQGAARWDVVPIRPPKDVIEFYAALARQGNDGPMAEVPITPTTMYGLGLAPQQLLFSAWHHRRTSACYASYRPPEVAAVATLSEALPSAEAVAELARLGFTTLIVHQMPGGPLRRHLDAAARENPALLRPLHATRWRAAYAIDAGPEGP